eukprot:1191631-Rhodomonas_salina.2
MSLPHREEKRIASAYALPVPHIAHRLIGYLARGRRPATVPSSGSTMASCAMSVPHTTERAHRELCSASTGFIA